MKRILPRKEFRVESSELRIKKIFSTLHSAFYTHNSSKGFTLIELMVAITIVAIMSVAGIIVYTQVQQNARDTKRREDINAIATALEGQKDPTTATYASITAANFPTRAIPRDPTGSTVFYCISASALGDNTVPSVPTSWTARENCPVNYNLFNTGNEMNGRAAWTICALLERGANPGNIVCRSNSQ